MTKYEMEYEEAPSGNITFYNYKEPLMKFEGGYGYMGALVFDSDSDKVQCHFCGQWFISLAPHLAKEHNMLVKDYKETVGLLQTTALIGEKLRSKLIATGLDKRMQNLRQRHMKSYKMSQSTKEKIRETLKKNADKSEMKNLLGTCPEQLLERLKKQYEKQGKNFKQTNVTYDYLLKRTFGSYKEAYRLAGVPYRKPGQNRNYDHKTKLFREDILTFVREYFKRFDKLPKNKDFETQGKITLFSKFAKNKKGLRVIYRDALAGMKEYRKAGTVIHFTKEQLLQMLRNFKETNGRMPAISDCKRNLLPHASKYYCHFGNWKTALKLAFNPT